MEKAILKVEGIKCEGCVNRINNVLSSIKKLTSYDVSLENKEVTLEAKNNKIFEEAITKIENLGFNVVNKS